MCLWGKVIFRTFSKCAGFIKALQNPHITVSNLDFRDNALYQHRDCAGDFLSDFAGDFFYFDPPYLITQAPYNSAWSEKDERDLYEILDVLNSRNAKFALSNVLQSNGKSNDLLKKWSAKYHTHCIKRDYANANYHRKNLGKSIEVLITNYAPNYAQHSVETAGEIAQTQRKNSEETL